MTVTQPTGVHHLAISTASVKTQIEFFTQVLGAKLVALYWMHGVEAWHAFVELNPSCSVAFVEMAANGEIEAIPGVTHSGTPADPSAPGTMQHVAFNADDLDQLLRLRDRIRDHGVTVLGPVDHGMCHSIYFGGPEGLTLEVATSATAIPADNWIDPEVVALAGISTAELAAYRNPPADPNGEPGSMAQPPLDTTKPAMGYPEEVLAILAAMSDDDVAASMNYPDPPVPTPRAS
ncbi:MAG: catechol 2,3-dioxygenase-like lactoylglutathione lyase family enzyme [Candidatus Aldehydirespiratoraceae bacterium]|jgi:catechol 2,3-dioxygenase-like lactoylglutathione lyase family enzyme